MKNLLLAICVILMDVMGCGPKHREDPDYLDVTPNVVLLMDQQGSKGEIRISSNVKWTIVADGNYWFDFEPLSGKDDGVITVTAKSTNLITNNRYGTIIIRGGNIVKVVSVGQKGKSSSADKENGA